jgi:hypothetical protein
LKISSEEASSQEVTQETTEGGCDPVNLGNTPAWNDIDELNRESISEWRRSLRNEIEKTSEVPPPTQKVYHALENVWDEFNGNKETKIKIRKTIRNGIMTGMLIIF